MADALEGILVVALEQAVAAPIASCRLADAGARIIKLERAEGDFSRGYDDYAEGLSSYFVWINRGKESCRVDLKDPNDLALVETMLGEADVFVQNLAPGATGRLGIGSAELRQRYPKLITCDISGYAPGTPHYTRKAYDLLIQAEAGLSAITGSENSGPMRIGVSIADIATGNAAYAAILEALLRRARTGQGSQIQLSLFDTIADLMNVPYLTRRYGGIEPPKLGLAHPSIAPYGVFRLADAEVLLAVQSEPEWRILAREVLRDEALADDPRFASNVLRVRNRAALDAAIQVILAPRSFAETTAALDKARIAYGTVSHVGDLISHPAATALPVETQNGPVEVLAPPAIVDGKRTVMRRVPALGEHEAALRREFAPKAARTA
ncbi:MAG TPA: CaiB/BaiF CoA-transferase family protein [Bosea sp. (in: a-proteobacteria)]|jgi:crotonobetainyl-CoA:carnitine CoA-transferase CaiB-like acyl-CoA transferase|uniref:CaiB/BaiF CoA transferase family protein n=1 Tax=Bosea sp. (in: a-proteobacteria) TaxID=1871050 RepID=UPI002E106E00|nr:CaiB/BaiF CoA-transferase family protein [Bosea sp. (in: a-proteobacteria)]